MVGTMVPMGVMFLRTPIYTRFFTTAEYGEYTLVYVVNSYISVFAFQWIINNIWRFYLNYKHSGQNLYFRQTILLLFITTSLVSLIVVVIWHSISDTKANQALIFSGYLFTLSESVFAILTIPMRINGDSVKFNTIQSLKVIVSFLLLLILTFIANVRIEAFFIAPFLVNMTFVSFLLLKVRCGKLINFKVKSLIPHLKRFFKYGYAMTIFNALSLFLVAGDRLLIHWFEGSSYLGIYNQTYNIAQLTIAALFGIFNAAINPFVLPLLERKDKNINQKIVKTFNLTILALLPVTVILSMFSKEISTILLGPDFREMWEYLPFVFFGSFMLGASHLAIIKLKFLMKTKVLIRVVFWAFIINLTSNLILIPLWGYKIATVTTLVSYLFQFIVLMRVAETGVLSFKNILHNQMPMAFIIFIIYVFHKLFLFFNLFDFKYGFVGEIIVLLILSYLFNAKKIYLLWGDQQEH